MGVASFCRSDVRVHGTRPDGTAESVGSLKNEEPAVESVGILVRSS
jgi:hypothetical protein